MVLSGAPELRDREFLRRSAFRSQKEFLEFRIFSGNMDEFLIFKDVPDGTS
jgi:hypothetical protein